MGFSLISFELSQSSPVVLAHILGYASIGFWLCAQLPQVFKNFSLQSCDGLALPFLVNWLFGDITNLIGCLLTDQLPFQTYLASYFCLVDLALLGQYFHYQPKAEPILRYTYSAFSESPQQVLLVPPNTAPVNRTRSASGSLLVSPLPPGPQTAGLHKLKSKRAIWSSSSQFPPADISISSPAEGSYAAIYEAALDVARAAERANAHSQSRKRKRRISRRNTSHSLLAESEFEIGEGALIESFHSEMSNGSRSTTKSYPRGVLNTGGANDRGRTLRRGVQEGTGSGGLSTGGSGKTSVNALSGVSSPGDSNSEEDDNFESLSTQKQGRLALQRNDLNETRLSHRAKSKESKKSRSLSLVRGSGGRGSRRTAGMAFMSLGLLVGWGGFSGKRVGEVSTHGTVLEPPKTLWLPTRHPPVTSLLASPSSNNSPFLLNVLDTNLNNQADFPLPPEDSPCFQCIIGRISAWSCTTLYLTSRMPQIWKNFQRKSVEGLSFLLFLFAFCGNVAYVASILLESSDAANPSKSSHYLLEALPYLLGSGGTLVFDLTIMIQSFVYGSAPPQFPASLDRSSRRKLMIPRKRTLHVEEGWGSLTQSQLLDRGERAPLLYASTSGLHSAHSHKGVKRVRSVSPTINR
ncbi:hypothetical protein L204_101558 [Cryptococcus depauperatus]